MGVMWDLLGTGVETKVSQLCGDCKNPAEGEERKVKMTYNCKDPESGLELILHLGCGRA